MATVEGCSLVLSSMEELRAEMDPSVLVETWAALLFRVAYAILRSRAEAEDVVQDVFVRVLEHRGRLHEVRDMRVWLVRIAWNLALDRARRVRPEQMNEVFAQSLVAGEIPADRALEDARRMQAVLEEMERLPKKERHVLLLAAVEGLETAEIAGVLGRSESAVRALLFRARARLKERLGRGEKRR